jgi:hypothetical protein
MHALPLKQAPAKLSSSLLLAEAPAALTPAQAASPVLQGLQVVCEGIDLIVEYASLLHYPLLSQCTAWTRIAK